MKRRIFVVMSLIGVILSIVFIVLRDRGFFLPEYKNDIDRFMNSRMKNMEVPGLAVGIVNSDGVVWEGYYGTFDGERPVSEDTMFMIASVSKTVVATAIMQLWELGYFHLDEDINAFLDFEVINPNHPDAIITFQDLMTHHSSIHDRYPFLADTYTTDSGGGDSIWELGEFLKAYLLQDGEFFMDENYLNNAPGEIFEYSNYGVALLAYLVEVISQEDFADYCRSHIFTPLGMDHSYFLIRNIPAREIEIAVPFHNGLALPQYNYPDYPTGSLRTTIRDMARLVTFYLDPTVGNQSVLQPTTIELMFGEHKETDNESSIGLIWWHGKDNSIGHDGSDDGVQTDLTLYPEEGFGTVIFMNGNPKNYDRVFMDVLERLHIEGGRLKSE